VRAAVHPSVCLSVRLSATIDAERRRVVAGTHAAAAAAAATS